MPGQNAQIAALLDQAGELLEIKRDNPYRARAYRRAARVIAGLPMDVMSFINDGGRLNDLPGIGSYLARTIVEIAKSGSFPLVERLKRDLPGDLGNIAALPGIGPKRLNILSEQFGVRTMDDLRLCAAKGRLRELGGFGAKSEARLMAALNKPGAPPTRMKKSETRASPG